MIAPHRQHPDRARERRQRIWAAVERALAGKTICGRCGATFSTYADLCLDDQSDNCPGLVAIDAAKKQAEARE